MPTSPEAPVAPPESACPKCQKPLTDPHGLGWCQACGYCRTLGDVCVPVERPAEKPAPAPQLPPTEPPRVPYWAIGLVLGMAALAVGSWWVGHRVALTPLHRAMWTSLQIGAGILVMFMGQCFALIRIAPEDSTLHPFDAVVPFRLYGLVFKRLPQLCAVLFFGGWGLTLIVAALACIGGLGHWLTYLPKGR